MRLPSWSSLLFACLATLAEASALEDDFITLSDITSPKVAYCLQRDASVLHVAITADAFPGSNAPVAVHLGVSADQTLVLTGANAAIQQQGPTTRWDFSLPVNDFITKPDAWHRLRLALAIEWSGGANSQPRLRQRFLHRNLGAIHSGLSPNPADWEMFDIEEFERQQNDRASQIHFTFHQPLDGKATIAIDGPQGRVRNLLSGQSLSRGDHRIVWDGLDDQGNVALPGNYQWRSISHPGLRHVHQMSFFDAPGSNHGTLQSAVTNGASLFFASPVAEGGWDIFELKPDGDFIRGFNPPHGHGLYRVALAIDDRYLYAVHDGTSWTDKVDKSKPNWTESRALTLMRINLAKGAIEDYAEGRYATLRRHTMGPGIQTRLPFEKYPLAGLAWFQGRLYLGDAEANELLIIDPATAAVEKTFPLVDPVALAASKDSLFAIAGGKLQKLDPVTGAAAPLATLQGVPAGLCVGDDNRFYISDINTHVVHVLDSSGKLLSSLGTPGGLVTGPYDSARLHNPTGLALLNGLLWVTEKDRWHPKRLIAFDIQTGQVAREYFGPTNYGAQGAGFDYEDHTRWIGQNTLFQLDFASGKATPQASLGGETGRRHTFWRQDGRTFVITSGKATFIQELLPNQTLKPLALWSSAHQFSYACDWLPPNAFVNAFKRDFPNVPYDYGMRSGLQRGKPDPGPAMLWVDQNGDTQIQAEEIEFTAAGSIIGGSGWSHDFHDLTMRVPGEINGRRILVTLKPEGWWPGGAPKYPRLNDAVRDAVPIDFTGTARFETITDRRGNTICNTDDQMRAFAPDGRLLWTFPNAWRTVHGSHNAPLPSPGQLQGVLFFDGLAPLDDQSDVFAVNGNHGRAFFLTSDGLYIDDLFNDIRLMNNPQTMGIGILGGECFGGTFGRSAKDGNFYFQGGGIAYHIYRVEGLNQTRRASGTLTITPEQSVAAERNQTRLAANQHSKPRTATVNSAAIAAEKKAVITWSEGEKFPVKLVAEHDGQNLRLSYTVNDQSPWVNNGSDWQSLFKTGDGVDFQIATDPAANPTRSSAAPGDLRLFVAPMGAENVAVLYRHRVPNAPAKDAVVFQSPWRAEKVDVVKRLLNAEIVVQRQPNQYTVTVSLPLVELGLQYALGKTLRGDFGVIYGNPTGTINILRNYWSNQVTGLINDVPGEIMLAPNLWSDITFATP